MKHNDHYDVDALIKNIYQAYIDIKSKDFDEIQKDMLLDNIKLLYSKVKEIPTLIKSNELGLESKIDLRSEPLLEISSVSSEKETPLSNPIENLKEDTQLEAKAIEISSPQDEAEMTIVASDTIDEKMDPEPSLVDKVSEIIPNDVSTETQSEELVEEMTTGLSSQTKTSLSSSNITDYLKSDNSAKRDIFDFIDINSRIGLVEIFFKGNSIELTEALSLINRTEDRSECMKILKMYANKNGISDKDDIYETFAQLIERKFQNNR